MKGDTEMDMRGRCSAGQRVCGPLMFNVSVFAACDNDIIKQPLKMNDKCHLYLYHKLGINDELLVLTGFGLSDYSSGLGGDVLCELRHHDTRRANHEPR